jgi:hypothetical protein
MHAYCIADVLKIVFLAERPEISATYLDHFLFQHKVVNRNIYTEGKTETKSILGRVKTDFIPNTIIATGSYRRFLSN